MGERPSHGSDEVSRQKSWSGVHLVKTYYRDLRCSGGAYCKDWLGIEKVQYSIMPGSLFC